MKNQETVLEETTIVRTFEAPREKVWRAWTDEKLMSQWFGPKNFITPVCAVDARQGGTLYLEMEDDGGNRYPMWADFEEVKEPKLLVFTAKSFKNDKGGYDLTHRTTVSLEEDGKKMPDGSRSRTKMTLHVAVIKADGEAVAEALKGMEMGWSMSFDKLANLAPMIR